MRYAQMLITGQTEKVDVPILSFVLKTKIFFKTMRTVYFYKKKGTIKTFNKLKKIKIHPKYIFLKQIEEYLFARNISSWTQTFINLIHIEAICLERSIVICAMLRYLGIPSQVIIARKAAMNASQRYEFHAWVELNGLPINEVLSTKTLFTEVDRYPRGENEIF